MGVTERLLAQIYDLKADNARLEKEADWLAKQAELLCNADHCGKCRAFCPDDEGKKAWIEAASKAVEKQCKSN